MIDSPFLSMIVACDKHMAIGKGNALPWGYSLKDDLARFKQLTINNTVIMGSKTYRSIGRALPGRKNIVLSRNTELALDGVQLLHSAAEVTPEVLEGRGFVIGGAQVYELLMDKIDTIYLTEVAGEFDGDVHLNISLDEFSEIERGHKPADDQNKHAVDYVVLKRN